MKRADVTEYLTGFMIAIIIVLVALLLLSMPVSVFLAGRRKVAGFLEAIS